MRQHTHRLLAGLLDAVRRALRPAPAAPGSAPAAPRSRVAPGSAPARSRYLPTTVAARAIAYAPQPDGAADPGEIVWAWVAYEDDPRQGKDRPVLVVGRDGADVLGLMLSSNEARDGQPHWRALGAGRWDSAGRPSWVRLDRVLVLPDSGIRREGTALDRARFDGVAGALRDGYGWT